MLPLLLLLLLPPPSTIDDVSASAVHGIRMQTAAVTRPGSAERRYADTLDHNTPNGWITCTGAVHGIQPLGCYDRAWLHTVARHSPGTSPRVSAAVIHTHVTSG